MDNLAESKILKSGRTAPGIPGFVGSVLLACQRPCASASWLPLRSVACLAFLALQLSTAREANPQPKRAGQEIEVTHRARSLQPGEVVLLKARSHRPLTRLRAAAFEREFPFFEAGDDLDWTGLIGIDLDAKPGFYTVRLHGEDERGEPVTADYTLMVKSKRFPSRELTVDEKFVSPPAEALVRIKKESEEVQAIFSATTTRRYWNGSFRLPVPGPVISEFGKRSVYNGKPRSPHTGTDFRGATGTPIRAPNAGRVVLAAELYYTGNTVIIDHGLGLYSYFGHLSAFAVQDGEMVKTGDIVGKVGATGLVTGPHLHWSVRLALTRVDPMSLISLFETDRKPAGSPVTRKK